MPQSEEAPLDKHEIVRLLADLNCDQARSRLHAIELEIVENLRERPLRTWCVGCFRLLRGIHRKAMSAEYGTSNV